MKKILAVLLAVSLILVCAVGGTLAWLTASSGPVVNTFTTSDIQVELAESTGTQYQMIPGYDISKDPKAKVLAGSEDCYLFVKLEKSANFDTYLSYTIADGWTKLTGQGITEEIYYRTVSSAEMGTAYSVLAGDKVTVKGTVTKADMTSAESAKPTLTITAYASQLHKSNSTAEGAVNDFTAGEAWANLTSTSAT